MAPKPPNTLPNRENKCVPELMKEVPNKAAEAKAQTTLKAANFLADVA
jgi:hypothetical protein